MAIRLEKSVEQPIKVNGVTQIEVITYTHKILDFDFWQVVCGLLAATWLRPFLLGYPIYALVMLVLTLLSFILLSGFAAVILLFLAFFSAWNFPVYRIKKLKQSGYIEVRE